jgi:hypothetical protein
MQSVGTISFLVILKFLNSLFKNIRASLLLLSRRKQSRHCQATSS